MHGRTHVRERRPGWSLLVAILAAVALPMTACGDEDAAAEVKPYELVADADGLNTVVLTERASERLLMETGQVAEQDVGGQTRLTVPYAAIIYDTAGGTWVYVQPEPLTYRRSQVVIDHIDGDMVVLDDGPEPGTAVAITSVAELYGADTGVGK